MLPRTCFLVATLVSFSGFTECIEKPTPTPIPKTLSDVARKTRLRRPGQAVTEPTPSLVLSDDDVRAEKEWNSHDTNNPTSKNPDANGKPTSIDMSRAELLQEARAQVIEKERELSVLRKKQNLLLAAFYLEDRREYRETVLRRSLEEAAVQCDQKEIELERKRAECIRLEGIAEVSLVPKGKKAP